MAGKGDNSGKQITDQLACVLASTFTLQLKTQNFHWNVTGPNFAALHVLFEGQYNELFAAVDEVAERIRALGPMAPGSYAAFQKLTTVEDAPAEPPGFKAMIAELAKDHETLSTACGDLRKSAESFADSVTGDLMNGRMMAHDKAGWMLRAHLE